MFIASLVTLCLCVAGLVGTTLAWFTDTASTGVNSITAGKIRVSIMGATSSDFADATYVAGTQPDGTKVTSRALKIDRGDGTFVELGSDITWEPGSSYVSEWLRVVNTGSLSLKYMGYLYYVDDYDNPNNILGDVIDVSITTDGQTYKSLGTLNSILNSEDSDGIFYGTLDTGSNSDALRIKLTMSDNPGTQYQGLSLKGFKLTIDATQYTGEFDSTVNTYDEDAEFANHYITFYSDELFSLTTYKCYASGLQYSTNAKSWKTFNFTTVNDAVKAVKKGDKYYLYLRGKNIDENGVGSLCADTGKYTNLRIIPSSTSFKSSTSGVHCTGNIMTLLDYENPDEVVLGECAFYKLFESGWPLVEAPSLPATTLAPWCYSNMFFGCAFMTSVPELPSATLASNCYRNMFLQCRSLKISKTNNGGTKLFVTPSETETTNCCMNMFRETGADYPYIADKKDWGDVCPEANTTYYYGVSSN